MGMTLCFVGMTTVINHLPVTRMVICEKISTNNNRNNERENCCLETFFNICNP